MTSALLVYLSTFVCVFALGLQSLNVNQGHYFAAAVTSFAIGSGNIFLYAIMPHPSGADLVGYYLGGMTGITASMWFHQRFKLWWQGVEFRFGPSPTWKWQYWIPHVVFPNYPNRLIAGCLGFWAFGRKMEVSWDFKRKASADPALQPHSVLSLKPGDAILYRCEQRLSMEARDRVRETLFRAFPGHRAIVIDGGAHLQIVRDPVDRTDTH